MELKTSKNNVRVKALLRHSLKPKAITPRLKPKDMDMAVAMVATLRQKLLLKVSLKPKAITPRLKHKVVAMVATTHRLLQALILKSKWTISMMKKKNQAVMVTNFVSLKRKRRKATRRIEDEVTTA
jgi:hypothetical protein